MVKCDGVNLAFRVTGESFLLFKGGHCISAHAQKKMKIKSYPDQEISVTQAYGDQDRTYTTMTTKAIFANFHSLLIDFCWIRVDFLT